MPADRTAARRGAPLAGWGDFRRCRAEPSGLCEVYFRYDDELEYWAKANNFTHGSRSSFPAPRFSVSRSCCRRSSMRRRARGPAHRQRSARHFADRGRTLTRCATSSPRASAATAGHAPTIRPTKARRRSSALSSSSDCRKAIDGGRSCRAPYALFPQERPEPGSTPRTDRETEGQFESLVRFELT